MPGYENAITTGESHLGMRESRRIFGDYVLTPDDLLNSARSRDVVALNGRSLDSTSRAKSSHTTDSRATTTHHCERSLPRKWRIRFPARHCIPSDHEANASLRGATPYMATGHAAWIAAALAAQGNSKVRDLDTETLQLAPKEQGTILSAE